MRGVGKLEADVGYIKRDLPELRTDVRQLRADAQGTRLELKGDLQEFRSEIKGDIHGLAKKIEEVRDRQERDFRTIFAAIISAALGLAGLLAKGFGWLH